MIIMVQMKLASGENLEMIRIGKEALDRISSSLTIRSEIALLTAEYACKSSDIGELEKCWLEAFRSNSTMINYLRLRFCTGDWSCYAEEIKLIYQQVCQQSKATRRNSYFDTGVQNENSLCINDYCVMLFFDEQFGSVYTIGMSEKNALGWSSTFMKEGLALMLLLLYKGVELPIGLKAMLRKVVSACSFKSEEYYRGTVCCRKEKENDDALFWNLFKQWKDNVQISKDEIEKWYARIDKWIALRVAGIMENNRRNYYGECASFIAAFGEAGESLDVFPSKSDIMEQ